MRFSFEHWGFQTSEYNSMAGTVSPYISRLSAIAGAGEYTEPESSICLPSDSNILASVSVACKEKIVQPLKFVVVVGIGGSNLGTRAVYDAILGYGDGLRDMSRPRMVFFGTDDEKISKANIGLILKNAKTAEDILVAIVSESGETLESIAQAEYVLNELASVFGVIDGRVVVVTRAGSPLVMPAAERGMTVITIPEKVGGRYSVFSAVGLLPLMAGGFDVNEFLSGALDMRAKCLSVGYDDNPALRSAAFLARWYNLGKIIHDGFYFGQELEALGKWHRQLLGESIGKSGKVGITPTVSIGSTDMHSVGQLYLNGPKDKTTVFITSEPENSVSVPKDRVFPNILPAITGKSFGDIMGAILSGVKIAYQRAGTPFFEVVLDGTSEREMGAFMMWRMIETMYVAQFLKVDAFDQPAVESYKKEAMRVLEEGNGGVK
jgi:glucose-6-phosphate isomerase